MKENKEKNDIELSAALSNDACLSIYNEETRSIIFWSYLTTILIWIL